MNETNVKRNIELINKQINGRIQEIMEIQETLGEWVHVQGKQLCHNHNCFLYRMGSSHKGKNLFPLEQIHSKILPLEQIHQLKSRSHFGKTTSSRARLFKTTCNDVIS